MKKRVLNLLFNDFTNDNRVLKESRTLQLKGFNVTLLATHFKRELPKEEVIEGFKVRRINVGRIKLLPLNLILFWIRVVFLYKKEDIIHANDLYALPPAVFIKKFINKRIKIVYDCHEHETEGRIYHDKPYMKPFAKFFEKKLINSADKVITVSESIAKDYEDIYGIEKPELVLNCPVLSKVNGKRYNLFREQFDIPKDKIIFLLQGGYMPGRGYQRLIEVFKTLEKTNEDLVLVFLIYGEGTEKLKDMIEGCKNIYWHEKVPVLEYMKYVNSADWGILLLENLCKSYDYSLPNKLFDYVGGGLPVVVSNLKELSNFVEKNKVGYVVDASSPKNVIEVLSNIDKESKSKFIKDLSITAKKYSWEEQEKVLLKIYKSL